MLKLKDFPEADIVIVGAGNAACCAAMAAKDAGAHPIVLETAPKSERAGNTFFVAGSSRWVFNNTEELQEVLDLTEEEKEIVDFGTYTREDFLEDLGRTTNYRCDPDLAEVLVDGSRAALVWMKSKGVKFTPMYKGQSEKIGDRIVFYGGQVCMFWGGGAELSATLHKGLEEHQIPVLYNTTGLGLLTEAGKVSGIIAEQNGVERKIKAKAIVLASGGFQADPEMRARYLGPGYELAKIRGTQHNNGLGIKMALDIGGRAWGHWSGAHAVGWDLNAPPYGDRVVGDGFQKHSYPYSIMINADGKRFIDEGADFRHFTYAKYGHVVQQQPGMFAWQVFDNQMEHMLRDEYRIKQVTKVTADTIEELAEKLEGVNSKNFLETVAEYNKAVKTDVEFNATILDGRGTEGLNLPKSNWAHTIEKPPFQAYAVTCGVTYTFGGVKIDTQARVEHRQGYPIPGLYAAGEMVGGLFYFNYPSGSGLVNGAVFGKLAGTEAGNYIKNIE